MNKPLLIFDTHPIQYRAPVFRELKAIMPQSKVYFFNDYFDGSFWWFQEVGKVTPQDFGLSLREGYESCSLQTNQMNLTAKYKALKKILLTEKPGAVLVYGYYLPEHWVLRWICAFYRIPLIFVGETFDWRGSFSRKTLKRLLISHFFKKVTNFVSVGKKNTDYYRGWGIRSDRITQANYCTDPGPFLLTDQQAEDLRKQTRAKLGISQNAFVLLFVGRLFNRKRPEDLLKIHQTLRKRYPVETVFVGEGELKESLCQKAKDLKGVHFVGFKKQPELKPYFYLADLLVVPSDFETWSLVVNEAFSCGTSAIVTDSCGVAYDLVVPQKTGEVYSVGNTDEAAQKIEALILNPKKLSEMKTNAKEEILTNYQPKQFAHSILDSFLKVTSVPT